MLAWPRGPSMGALVMLPLAQMRRGEEASQAGCDSPGYAPRARPDNLARLQAMRGSPSKLPKSTVLEHVSAGGRAWQILAHTAFATGQTRQRLRPCLTLVFSSQGVFNAWQLSAPMLQVTTVRAMYQHLAARSISPPALNTQDSCNMVAMLHSTEHDAMRLSYGQNIRCSIGESLHDTCWTNGLISK